MTDLSATTDGRDDASGDLLLLRTTEGATPDPEQLAGLATLGTVVRQAVLTKAPTRFAGTALAGQPVHVLRAGRTRSRWRRPLLQVADRLAPRPARLRYALSFDPWFRVTLRTVSAVVVLGPGGHQVARVAQEFAPGVPVHVGTEALRQVAREKAVTVAATSATASGSEAATRAAATLLPTLTHLLGEDDPLLIAWSTWRDLELGHRPRPTDDDIARRCGHLLASLDPLLDDTTSDDVSHRLAEVAAVALDLLFHPTVHGGAAPSLLATDPGRYLEPVRATRVWRHLTAPTTAPEAARSKDSAQLRVLLLPGRDAEGLAAVHHCLQVAPTVKVSSLPTDHLDGPLGGTTAAAYLVERRLRTVQHGSWKTDAGLLAALSGQTPPDVVMARRGDRTAALTSLMLPGTSRLLLRVEAGDLTLPWVHLLDWGRVAAVLADDRVTIDRVHHLIGGPAQALPAHVIDLGAPTDDLAATAAGARLRTLVLGELGELVELSAQGRHAEALDLARAVLANPDATSPVLRQAAQVAGRSGEVTLQLDLLRRWADAPHGPHPRREQLVSRHLGRLGELTPGWRPGGLTPTTVQSVPGRVLHLLKTSLPHRTSGYAVRSSYLLRERSRAGNDVLAVTALDFPETGAPPREAVGEVTHLRLLRDQVPEDERLDDHQDALARALLAVVQEHRPAVLHAHSGHRGYDLVQAALAVGRVTGIPVVYEVRGLFEAVWTYDAELAKRSELYALRHAVEASCLVEADAVVTLSESMRQDLLAGPFPEDGPVLEPERVFVVPNGVDPDSIRPRPRRPDLVERHGLQGRFTFGYVSNLDHPREGQEVLIEAVQLLRGRGVPATAVIVGGGDRRGELEALAARHGVAEQVVFTGLVPHDEVGDYYALLDVFVVPRTDERAARLVTPLKPYEAMSMGLPVVVSDLPALREIIGDEERGLAFPPADARALADVLQSLAADGAARDRWGAAGQEWVRSHRTWRSLAARYDEVYALVTGRNGIPGA